MKKILLGYACSFLFTFGAFGQDSRIALSQALRDLSNGTVVMNLSAHPDDEDGATLAYYRKQCGATTYSVLFTRGEGGQNEKGSELYEALGVIRSLETEEAGAILGTNVVFLNFLDFGFSKTASEALRVWGGQTESLRRLVYVIRKYKPDVLFTNHNTIDGHGHHQAVAITAIAAFDAASDPRMFPEQLGEPGLTLWQPRKLFVRASGKLEGNADVSNRINEPLPGGTETALDIAMDALHRHRTQGMEKANLRAFTRGRSQYKLMRSNSAYNADSTNFFGGIDLWNDAAVLPLRKVHELLNSLRVGAPVDSIVQIASRAQQMLDSLSVMPGLSSLTRRILIHEQQALESVLKGVAGIGADAKVDDIVVVPGQSFACTLALSGAFRDDIRWKFDLPPGWGAPEAQGKANGVWKFKFTVPLGAPLTVPKVVMQYRSLEMPSAPRALATGTFHGWKISVSTPISFDVAPRQTIDVDPADAPLLSNRQDAAVSFQWKVRNWTRGAVSGFVRAVPPPGWRSAPQGFSISGEDGEADGVCTVLPPAGVAEGDYPVRLGTALCDTVVHVHVFGATVAPGTRIGIVRSFDNTLEVAAKMLGVPADTLADSVLVVGNLSRYSAIVVDIRAYLVRDSLRSSNARLLDYARNGGTLVVMYQKDQEWKPEYAPYPFRISRRRVTMEDMPVKELEPVHPLLIQPNLIRERDWTGWKQERGVYFPDEVPSTYHRLLACADPDEEPLTTGYLVANVGAGAYIYTSLVWYRQLKEGNPGAFRCFANMISYRWNGH